MSLGKECKMYDRGGWGRGEREEKIEKDVEGPVNDKDGDEDGFQEILKKRHDRGGWRRGE